MKHHKAASGTLISKLANAGIASDVANLMVNDTLSYSAMLTILDDAAVGGMNASKFSTLQTLASMLNAPGGIATSTYVQDMADDVIDGDPANATWTGGASRATALGNLNSASTQGHVNELIGKWFLGTDLPSTNVSSIGETNFNSTYKYTANPLYGPSGSPSYLDVNQGYDGDCYFMSSLAEVALQDPTGIQSMITDNGNGTYGVRFIVDGQAEYVTVNGELPTMPSGYRYANGSSLEFANGDVAWPELLEKAYAELNAEPNAPHGEALNAASNSYAGIDSGSGYALTEITGQAVTGFSLNRATSQATIQADLGKVISAWNNKEELLVGTSNIASGNIVADHMFQVVGFNAATDMLTLHNPWGSAYSGPLAMTFTESLSQLASVDATVFMTTGKPIA
jgi:calpain family cysteine protease